MAWDQIGFNKYFQRRLPQEELPSSSTFNPVTLDYTIDSYSQSLPGSLINNGVIQSQNGNLTLDLQQGQLTYNDGTTNLLNVGGPTNNLTIQNSSGTSIVQTSTTTS